MPPEPWSDFQTRLRDTLEGLIDEWSDAKTVVADAGLTWGKIDTQGDRHKQGAVTFDLVGQFVVKVYARLQTLAVEPDVTTCRLQPGLERTDGELVFPGLGEKHRSARHFRSRKTVGQAIQCRSRWMRFVAKDAEKSHVNLPAILPSDEMAADDVV